MIAETNWSVALDLGLSWFATYLLHSTVLLGLAWLVTLRGLSDVVSETIWKAALVGGLVTATWQVGFAGASETQLELTWAATPEPVTVAALPEAITAAPAPGGSSPPAEVAAGATAETAVGQPWIYWAGLLYAAVVAIGLVRFARAQFGLRRRLAGRQLVVDGSMSLALLRLERAAGLPRAVRLTASEKIPTPIAFGFSQPEICVPARALRDLGPGEQSSMLAHELAHLLRRDPAWLLYCHLLQLVLFVQPLHLLASHRLRRLAEYRCDSWAARQTRDHLSLARCLVAVAEWMSPPALPMVHVAGMASQRSLLRQRVGRLLQRPAPSRSPRTAAAVCAAAVMVAATALPGASWRRDVPRPTSGPLVMLPLDQEADALERELTLLDRDLSRLRAALAGDSDPRVLAVLRQIEAKASELRQRRDRVDNLRSAARTALAGASRFDRPETHQKGDRR